MAIKHSQRRPVTEKWPDSLPSIGTAINNGLSSFATAAEDLSLRAQTFRDDILIAQEEKSARRRHISSLKIRLNATRERVELEEKLDANPEARRIYEALQSGVPTSEIFKFNFQNKVDTK